MGKIMKPWEGKDPTTTEAGETLRAMHQESQLINTISLTPFFFPSHKPIFPRPLTKIAMYENVLS